MSSRAVVEAQRALCMEHGVAWTPSPPDLVVGLARNVGSGLVPLHGLRHRPVGQTTGWYLWAGEEPSPDDDFFEPVHVAHLEARCPEVLRFLGLPPGWRFLTDGDFVDVWEDASLLDV